MTRRKTFGQSHLCSEGFRDVITRGVAQNVRDGIGYLEENLDTYMHSLYTDRSPAGGGIDHVDIFYRHRDAGLPCL